MSDATAERQVELSIVVVSYNTRDLTLRCLDSIVRETRIVQYEVIVVDNASTDGSAEAVAGHCLRPKVIASPANLGFAPANNLAATYANGKFLLLLNPDTEVLDGAIDRIVDVAKREPGAGLWGGRTLFADRSLNPSSCWARMTLWNLFCRASGLTGLRPRSALFNGEGYGGWSRDHDREVDIVSGCFLLTAVDDWRKLGGFDPAFFMYGEDADLCLRARKAGARPMISPEATIIHLGGASEPVRSAKMVRLLTAKAMLIHRHFPKHTRHVGLALLAAWPVSRWIACMAAGHLLRHDGLIQSGRMWRSVCAETRTWIGGYRLVRKSPKDVREASIASDAPAPVR